MDTKWFLGHKSSLAQRVLKVPREFFGPKGHYGSVSFEELQDLLEQLSFGPVLSADHS